MKEFQLWWLRLIRWFPANGELALCEQMSRRRAGGMSCGWSLRQDFIHSLGQHPEQKSFRNWDLQPGQRCWFWTPPHLVEHGLRPGSQMSVCNFGCSVTAISKFGAWVLTRPRWLWGDRCSCTKSTPAQDIQMTHCGDCSPCSSSSSTSPETELYLFSSFNYLAHIWV